MLLWRLVRGFFRGFWRLLTWISRGITVLLPILLLAYLVGMMVIGFQAAQPEPIPERAALLVNPAGRLVENRTPREPLEALLEGDSGEILLSDVLEAINRAADDPRITALVLDLQSLSGPTVTQGLELADALLNFRSYGKPVIAVGDYFDQSHYLLAAQADRIILHPEGGLNLTGFGVYRSYIRQLLDNAMVTMNVFRVGEAKSAVEPFIRDDMSSVEREVTGRWLGALWHEYTTLVERGRGLPDGFVQTFVDEFPDRLEVAGGDPAQLALDSGLVDELRGHSAQDELLAELVGATDDNGDYMAVTFEHYLMTSGEFSPEEPEGQPVVAVVPIEGELIPGESLNGFAGSDTVVDQLDMALDLGNLEALVLRINSPGGSVFASEVIRQKIRSIKSSGIPVVVSMAGMAASGGYYIAAEADQIWAYPATITGSIGVFVAFPTVEKLYDWMGIGVDGVATGQLAGAVRFDTGVDDAGRRIINSVISNVYEDFVALVADGRGLSWEQVNEIAQGKVWSGRDGEAIGLVDELGNLEDAVAAAASLAGVEAYSVRRVGTPLDPQQLLFEELGRKLGRVGVLEHPVAARLLTSLREPLRLMDSLRDPRSVYVRCLECSGGI